MRTATFTSALIASAGLVLGSSGCASPEDPEVAVVEIDPAGFAPVLLVVAPGTEVRWTNDQPQAHTVTSGGPLPAGEQAVPEGAEGFDSGRLLEGESFTQVFDVEGEYYYWCRYHGEESQMVGTIRVEEP